jgi:hypothetical protein
MISSSTGQHCPSRPIKVRESELALNDFSMRCGTGHRVGWNRNEPLKDFQD